MKPPSVPSPTCSEIRERLSAYLDGELSPLEVVGMRHHLGECPGCRREMERLADLSSFLRLEGRKVPPAPAWEAVEKRLAARAPGPQPVWWRGLSTTKLVALAASLAAVVAVGLFFEAGRTERLEPVDLARTPQGARLEIRGAGLPGLGSFLEDHRATEIAEREQLRS